MTIGPWKKAAWALIFIAVFCTASTVFAQQIEWKIFTKPRLNDGPILTKTTNEGETFVLLESDCEHIPSESSEIVGALDGLTFTVRQKPVTDPLAIHIILNVDGNTFEPAGSIGTFLNMTFAGYVNGTRDDFIDFDRSPVVMTITETGLNSLLALCNQGESDLVCAYLSGSSFSIEGIETMISPGGMTVKMSRLAKTVGGSGKEFGVTSGVRVNTWNKIKLLFK